MIKELKEFEVRHYLVVMLVALASVGPGFLCVFHFKPSLIVSLDIIKLLVLSVSLTLPLTIFNSLLFSFPVFGSNESPNEEAKLKVGVLGLLYAAFSQYSGLYIAYMANLTFLQYTYAIIALETILLIGIIRHECKKKKQPQQPQAPPLGPK